MAYFCNMIILLSPAKKLEMEGPSKTKTFTIPDRMEASEQLIGKLKKMSSPKIKSLMSLSDNLAELNRKRYQAWSPDFSPENARQAGLAFRGDVYRGLDADSLSASDLKWAQKHVRILSGLHGLLRPLDLIQAYRLEMGTKLPVGHKKNLYEFWGDKISEAIQQDLGREKVIVNLASTEYAKAARLPKMDGVRVITPEFRDFKNGTYKSIQLYLKVARGYMTRYAIQNRVKKAEDLQSFDLEGYSFDPNLSEGDRWVFTRG